MYCIVVCVLLGNSLASKFYMPTFQNTPSVPSIIPVRLWRWKRQSVLERWHIKFRCRAVTQTKAYNVQNRVKVWN